MIVFGNVETSMPPTPDETPAAIRLLFCGADAYWKTGIDDDLRRRNLFFLRSFLRAPEIGRVYVLQVASRLGAWKNWWANRGTGQDPPKATSILVVRWLPERDWLPLTARFNRRVARWSLKKRIAAPGHKTVVWCYGLSGLSMAEYLDLEARWLVDTDHNVVHDPHQPARTAGDGKALVLRCARKAKRVLSASRSMLRWLNENGVEHTARLRNGVCPERFATPARGASTAAAASAPVLGYVGILSPWVDVPLLVALARRRPDWRFVIAGLWYRMSRPAELEDLDNVQIRGYVASHELPDLFREFHVGLGLYRNEPWLDVDSMKLFEYLAAGVPTVSTPFHAHLREDFEGLVAVAEDVPKMEAKVEEILGWSVDELSRWRERSHDFVARNSWARRGREALDVIRAEAGIVSGSARRGGKTTSGAGH